jgi:hypothetical protein
VYQILAYAANNAALAVLADTPNVSDQNFVPRNGHWFFQEPYELMAKACIGLNLTAAQLFDSTWNAINVPQIYPINLLATIPSNPQVEDLRLFPIDIPQNEEIALQLSNNLGAGNQWQFGLLWISPKGSSRQLPSPPAPIGNMGRVRALFTATIVLTAGQWSPDVIITIPNLLRGGTYCVAGLNIVCPNGIAYRLNFPRAPLFMGRKLVAGNLVDAAYGNVVQKEKDAWLGPLGYFDNVEYPLISILGAVSTASTTYTGYLDLIYLGQATMGQTGAPVMAT